MCHGNDHVHDSGVSMDRPQPTISRNILSPKRGLCFLADFFASNEGISRNFVNLSETRSPLKIPQKPLKGEGGLPVATSNNISEIIEILSNFHTTHFKKLGAIV